MPEVYYYAKSEDISDIIDCGLKLSAFYDKEVEIEGEKKLCFAALINPKDDSALYKSDTHTCLKLQVKSNYCFVADRFLYETCLNSGTGLELYYKSVIPVEKYTFGTYRSPECLVTTTVLAGDASVLGKRMDSPILYENSELLYINNIIEEFRERLEGFDDSMLYYFFDKLADLSEVDKIENSGKSIFIDKKGRTFCIKKPDIDKTISALKGEGI
jgi:hypothetical protein